MGCFLAARCVIAHSPVAIMPARICATQGLVASVSLCRGRSPHAIAARQLFRRGGRAAWTLSPPATRSVIRNCHVGCIGARSIATRESARLAWCVLNRSAAVAHQVGWWSATRSRRKSSAATSLVAARRTAGGIGAVSAVAHCLGSLLSLKVANGIPISARYHAARSSDVGSMHAIYCATAVIAHPAWKLYSLMSLVPVAGLLFHHLSLVGHQLHLAHFSAQFLSLVAIQPHIHAILGTALLVLCQ